MNEKRQENRLFGKNIKIERLRLGLNQSELAQIGGVSKATQVAYEADSTRPDATYLARVSEVGVDVHWLLTGRRAAPGVQWELLFEISALVDEWIGERGKPTPPAERNDLLRNLYAQFCADNRIDIEQMRATFRLVK
ncbi:helix-turn-helix domain-containing protein [Lysobacter capsici]|jgi:transcriptional regulator with XRE-family HTH domain|uniref:helix-turn-helix domain-containing protein n=1 Tax=Lysobacter capsici TaxID=435897 RepID=UPI001784C794|nr:helix-turn-helix domain-containing protein [Lysobacter capsici]UOF14485.1 helix-turn-helix domain-containing protein [Lysobacter capsici]